ncbi:hypothetical protein DRH29_00750 [candidate division Kazan bacterium]|uniref:Uncharacterized protein n=1 Tax=candidate division Kazan bacterium TaxID=2202143 RepID=A0A420ZDW0_UNCK3|nr:MAG: hypothetical protein DRH29_00750 [candidate division Kazan bacterium]
MRYLATIMFMVLGFGSILLADNGYWPHWVWAIILFFAPWSIFTLIGRNAQYQAIEFWQVIAGGLIGWLCFLIWLIWGGLDYQMSGFWHHAHIFMFWGYAFLSCVKVGGTLMAWFTPGRYNPEYLEGLK